jgi:hypothetical protein
MERHFYLSKKIYSTFTNKKLYTKLSLSIQLLKTFYKIEFLVHKI